MKTLIAAAAILLTAGAAHATCRIHNQTKYSFRVESGNVSNQSLGANTITSIAPGKIIAKSNDGKSFGGSCTTGDQLVVKEEKGVVVMMHK